MIYKTFFTMAMLTSYLCTTNVCKANDNVAIAVLSDAQIFAQFDDELPAVMNYFTAHNEQEILAFYQKQYGDIELQDRKRGRLTTIFNHNDQKIRVIISSQNNQYQVDILVQ